MITLRQDIIGVTCRYEVHILQVLSYMVHRFTSSSSSSSKNFIATQVLKQNFRAAMCQVLHCSCNVNAAVADSLRCRMICEQFRFQCTLECPQRRQRRDRRRQRIPNLCRGIHVGSYYEYVMRPRRSQKGGLRGLAPL